MTAAGVEPPRFMQAWEAKRAGLGQPATTSGQVFVQRGERPRYVEAALSGETEAVARAAKGERNGQLNTSALKLGRIVAAGVGLSEEEAVEALTAAATMSGLVAEDGVGSVRATIRSGMRRGLQEPRDPGEAQNTGQTVELRPLPDLGPVSSAAAATVVLPPDPVAGYLQPAGTYLRGLPESPEPVWGQGDVVLWAQGEALMIAGSPGLGKTTLAGQLVRARLGFQASVLDMPVLEGEQRVLYLMMDRPRQIARRLMQQFTPAELDQLDARMQLGVGPPPQDMARHPDLLTELCMAAQADTVVVDSLKDAAIGLVEDEVGAGWNRARQLAVAAGVQVLELHHLVKRGANGKDPDTLADVYGSGHLTSGAGSVLVLLGDAGSPIVRAKHLKPVAEPFGPAQLVHDHAKGTTTVQERVNLLELLAITQVQTPRTAAMRLFDVEKPKPSDLERARRALEKLVSDGKAVKRAAAEGRGEATYHPLTARGITELSLNAPAAVPAFEQNPLELED